MNKKKKVALSIVAVVVLVAAIVGGVLFYKDSQIPRFTIEVTNQDSTSTYKVKSNEQFLKGVMDDCAEQNSDFTYEGYDSDFGFTLTTINDYTADFNTSSEYWAIYINDDYAQNGCDTQEVHNNDKISFKVESFE